MSNPSGVAVDNDAASPSFGDVYVADTSNSRIDKYGPDGKFLLAWGLGVADGASPVLQTCGPQATPSTNGCFAGLNVSSSSPSFGVPGAVTPGSVAVDQSNGDVYVTDQSRLRVTKFGPGGEFLLMFGKAVNSTPGAANPSLCTAADLAAGDTCGKGARGAGATEFFSGPTSVAVDTLGHVWVGDTSRLVQFYASGEYISQAPIGGGGNTKGLAIDSAGDFYVKSSSLAGVRKLEPSGSPVDTLTLLTTFDAAGQAEALALDSSGNVYVGDKTSPYRFMEFDPAGAQVSQFGTGQVLGTPGRLGNALAIGARTGSLFSVSSLPQSNSAAQAFTIPLPGPLPEGEHAVDVLPTTATLAAELNPEGHVTTYHFEYDTSPYGEGEGAHGTSVPVPAATLAAGFEDREVQADLVGLTPATTYHFRLVGTNHCNPAEPAEECTVYGEDHAFATRPAVAIEAEWVTDVSSTAATFHSELDPLGAPARWWIEYGTTEAYGATTVPSGIAAGMGAVPVQAHVQGLGPATQYHYRLAAEDERDGVRYTVRGPDRSFTTQLTAAGFELIDGRAWEQVSPIEKEPGLIVPAMLGEGQGITQASAGGDALTYLSVGPVGSSLEANRAVEPSQSLARHTGLGWASTDITTPSSVARGITAGTLTEYVWFSSDLAKAAVQPLDAVPLSPAATERTPYIRSNFAVPPTYSPLVTAASVPPGTEFGGSSFRGLLVQVQGADADLGQVVLRSQVPLVDEAPANALYLAGPGGSLRAISVLPEGEGGGVVAGELGAGVAVQAMRHAVSSDGSRVFWTAGAAPSEHLYMRDTIGDETVRLDVVQPGASGAGAAHLVFQGANADGSRAFFTDTQRLTGDASSRGADLYVCTIAAGAGGRLGCDLRDLTPNGTEGADVQGLVSGLSVDGAHLYLVANGALAPGADPGDCTNSPDAEATCGLYSLVRDDASGEWRTRFVATLSNEDADDWGVQVASTSSLRNVRALSLSAQTSPDGRYLVFMSRRALTGYDNRDAAGGEPVQEVYRYDASNGGLSCVSCNPSGARPLGQRDESTEAGVPTLGVVDPKGNWLGQRLAADVRSPNLSGLSEAVGQPRFVLDDGRVFFNAVDSLVPADVNGQWDVYEYEPAGLGGCGGTSGGSAIVHAAGGCVALISSGADTREAGFLDSSTSGDDVFILTAAPLAPGDVDARYDIYDAHVCGSGWQCAAPPPAPQVPCASSGSCRSPGVGGNGFGTPGSSGFNGPGNKRGGRNCSAVARRTRTLGKRAKLLRRSARKATKDERVARLRKQAANIAKRAKKSSRRVKACRKRSTLSSVTRARPRWQMRQGHSGVQLKRIRTGRRAGR